MYQNTQIIKYNESLSFPTKGLLPLLLNGFQTIPVVPFLPPRGGIRRGTFAGEGRKKPEEEETFNDYDGTSCAPITSRETANDTMKKQGIHRKRLMS